MVLELHARYDRRAVAKELDLAWNRSVWEQGVVRRPPWLIMFVTLDKTGIAQEHHYADKFLSDTCLRWQSQNRESRASTRGEMYVDPVGHGMTPLLFVRETKMLGAKARPFVFMGEVAYKASRGDNPITVVWDLEDPVPPSLWDAFAVVAPSSLSTEDTEAAESPSTVEDARLIRNLAAALSSRDHSAEDLWAAARLRPGQRLFRKLVMMNFSGACCVCGLRERALLDAAHITGYAKGERTRNDPANGLALCVLHHRALDRDLIQIGADGTVHVAEWLSEANDPAIRDSLLRYDGRKISRAHFAVALPPSSLSRELPPND